jgi:WD40 repeat protein
VVWNARGAVIARAKLGIELSAVAFDPTGARLAVGGNSEAQLLQLSFGTLSTALTIEGPVGEVRSLAFSRDGSRVITAGSDGVAKIWDASKGKLLATRDPHGGAIDAIAVSADDAWLWTASADGTAREWDVHAVKDSVDLDAFLARRVPWRLGDDDVVRRVTDTLGGQR